MCVCTCVYVCEGCSSNSQMPMKVQVERVSRLRQESYFYITCKKVPWDRNIVLLDPMQDRNRGRKVSVEF